MDREVLEKFEAWFQFFCRVSGIALESPRAEELKPHVFKAFKRGFQEGSKKAWKQFISQPASVG